MKLHIDYCAEFGISLGEMEATEEQMACTAYTRYVLDVGQSEDWLALQMALAPCLLGYGAVGRALHDDPRTDKTDANTYWRWILNYVADDYVEAVRTGRRLLERHAALSSPSRVEELVKIFIHATKVSLSGKDRRGVCVVHCANVKYRWKSGSGRCTPRPRTAAARAAEQYRYEICARPRSCPKPGLVEAEAPDGACLTIGENSGIRHSNSSRPPQPSRNGHCRV